jgi:hypothetical protein
MGIRSFVRVTNCRYRAFTVASCAKGLRDNHDLILHTNLYCMRYRTCTSEIYRHLFSVVLHGLIWSGLNLRERESLSYITTDGQSASLSWFQAPIWGLWPDFYYCPTIAGFDMVRPLWREDGSVFYNVQCTIYNAFYCLRFETRSLYLYPPGTGWPGYAPRHWVNWTLSLSLAVSSFYITLGRIWWKTFIVVGFT